MEKVILETMLSESEGRERIARKVIADLRKQIDELKIQLSKEVKVVLTPINKIHEDDLSKMSGKDIYEMAQKNGYPIYTDKQFCEDMNYNIIGLDHHFITITKDY